MSNKISRRNFLHTAGLGTLGAAAAGLLTACGDKAASGSVASSAAAAGTYTAGTYSATATGINTTTPVTVTMTFSADAITDVQIDVANETKGYGADIADEMVRRSWTHSPARWMATPALPSPPMPSKRLPRAASIRPRAWPLPPPRPARPRPWCPKD